MNRLALFAVAVSIACVSGVAIAKPPAAKMAAALADPGRPADDLSRDAARKPAEVIAFSGLHAGDRVIDFIPAGGYWTRIFAGVVGPKGHVYALVPGQAAAFFAKPTATIAAFAATHPNVEVVTSGAGGFAVPGGPVDMFWTAQNYHDLYNPLGKDSPKPTADTLLGINKAVFAALKPGGIYLVIDHVAPTGSGTSDTNTLHRIDPEVIKKDVTAAGFTFVGASDVLRNPADPHDKIVFDASIRGHTDQVVFKFRKPG